MFKLTKDVGVTSTLASSGVSIYSTQLVLSIYIGAPVAQWVKRWPTDLAVPSSSPARGEIFSTAHSLSLSSVHRPDITETLLKRT